MRENSGVIRILTDAEMAGERLDLVLAAALDGVSRSAVQKLMAAGAVTADGQPVDAKSINLRVLMGDNKDCDHGDWAHAWLEAEK